MARFDKLYIDQNGDMVKVKVGPYGCVGCAYETLLPDCESKAPVDRTGKSINCSSYVFVKVK